MSLREICPKDILQLRRMLAKAGFYSSDPNNSTFDHELQQLLVKFQLSRNLPQTGLVDENTWQALSEATYRLGERLLYLRQPRLRGDDVADLQDLLTRLGFDCQKVDGVFGPNTDVAIRAFQAEMGLTVDGILGPATLREIRRILPPHGLGPPVTYLKEHLHFSSHANQPALCFELDGTSSLPGAIKRELVKYSYECLVLSEKDEHIAADFANSARASIAIGIKLSPKIEHIVLYYFQGIKSYSPLAKRICEAICDALNEMQIAAYSKGSSLIFLKETKMPAFILEIGTSSQLIPKEPSIASAVASKLAQ